MNKGRTYSLITLVIVCCSFILTAQSPYRFSHLTVDDGLADSWTHNALLDSRGFMWFATNGALCRFDGTTFKNYRYVQGDTTSLHGHNIMDVVEDKDGDLWVATIGGGLNRFDFETESFEFFPLNTANEQYQRKSGVTVFIDSDENIWLGTFDTGFHLFDKVTKKFKRYNLVDSTSNHEEAFRMNSVLKIIEDVEDPSILWLASNNGLFSFHKQKEELTFHPIVLGDLVDSLTTCLSVFMDRPGELWVGTWALGICKFNTHKKEWTSFIPSPEEKAAMNFFSNIIDDIERKSAHEMWVCSRDQGLMVFNIKDGTFSDIKHNPGNPYSIGSDKTNGIYIDPYQRKWIFNFRDGISVLDPAKQQFNFTNINAEDICPDIKDLEVVDFAFDNLREQFYVSTAGCEGIHVFSKSGVFQKSIELGAPQTGGGIRYKIHVDSKGLIWVLDYNVQNVASKIWHLDPNAGELYPFKPSNQDNQILVNINTSSICEDIEGNIWLGTRFGGLIKINRKDNSIHRLVKDAEHPNYLDGDLDINEIKPNSKGGIWIATLEDGVYAYRPETDDFLHYPAKDNSPTGLVDKRIMTIQEDKNGMVWVGTSDNGIQIIDPENPNLEPSRSFTLKDGLLSEKNCRIIRDKWDNIWVSTHRGICRYDYQNDNFIHYTEKDGIEDPMLLFKGFSTNSNGDIFIGQYNGFYTFRPYNLKGRIQSPKLAFTYFKLFEDLKRFDKDLNFVDKISLAHNENFFSIGFAALQFTSPEKNRYAYKMEGYDADWTYPQDRRSFASYTKVPAGEYTLRVKAANNEGVWSKQDIELKIQILSPWWKSNLAYLCYLIGFIALLYFGYKFTIQRKIEQREAQRIKELDRVKTRLYTNITHEFRTPLTLILGPVERAISETRDLRKDELDLIKRNSNQLLSLINQMLDLGKLDAGAIKPNFHKGDVIKYVEYLTESFDSYAGNKNIDLNFTSNVDEAYTFFDKEMMLAILSNLISNAIKFTPNGGQIDINISVSDESYLIEVKDSGIGIAPNKIDQIFDRFYQVDDGIVREQTGTGIGLALVKELIELLSGTISVQSAQGKGSLFKIFLPLWHEQPEGLGVKKSNLKEIPVAEAVPFITEPVSKPIKKESKSKSIILTIEDNKDVAQYISSGLDNLYETAFAYNGQEGIDKAFDTIPDLIICDVMMPMKNGFEVCKILKNDPRTSHIPVILLTAKSGMESKLEGLDCGADVYLTKPFNDRELKSNIRNLLNLRKKLQNHYLSHTSVGIPEPPAPELASKEDVFLKRVAKIIEDNLDNPALNVSLLSQQLHLSHTQCHRKLIALTGEPPVKIIRGFRMRKAKTQLENTSMNVSEIAYSTGFSNPAYFTRIFKQEYGFSPSEYRKTIQKK